MHFEIKKPCAEKWEKMQGSDKEKFCQQCKCTVHNFVNSDEDEILSKLLGSDDFCGRFTQWQLDKDYTLSWLKKTMVVFIAAGAMSTAEAQKLESVIAESGAKSLQEKESRLQIENQNNPINCKPPANCFTIHLGQPNLKSKQDKNAKYPLIVIDGKKSTAKKYVKLKAKEIDTIKVLRKEDDGIEKYGKEGEDGVIIVTLKK